jgi:spore coat polysaccharide biosynthesis protein SpsF
MVRALVQARMSSVRFPGKVLAPCAGRPLIWRVIERVREVLPMDRITLATSADASDDPLAAYAASLGVDVFRGPLDDVVERFGRCLEARPCEWFFRVCADSPLLDPAPMRRALEAAKDEYELDLVTNTAPRTFPRGQSVELVRSSRFAELAWEELSAEDREHATRFFYAHPERFRILNLESTDPSRADLDLAVDTPDDLRRVERILLGRGGGTA